MNKEEFDRKTLMEMLDNAKKNLEGKQIVIWGTGNTANLYQENIKKLEEEGLNIICYVDGNSQKWGMEFNGRLILNPQKIKELEQVFVIICSMNPINTLQIISLLSELEVEGDPIDKVIFSRHCKEVIECYDMLEDMESKRVYAALIKARMEVQNPPLSIVSPEQYYLLPQFSLKNENEVLVECGCYIGDTLETYVRKKEGKFRQIISFDPDANNLIKAKEKVIQLLEEFQIEKNKIKLYPYAVGDKEHKSILMRSNTNKGNLTQVVPIDAVKNQCNKEFIETVVLDNFLTMPYSFLKADVEGCERQVLIGAKKGIRKYKPLLAICIYHNAMDFYEIPILIKSIVSEYKLIIRHHLKTLSETVIYAYIDE